MIALLPEGQSRKLGGLEGDQIVGRPACEVAVLHFGSLNPESHPVGKGFDSRLEAGVGAGIEGGDLDALPEMDYERWGFLRFLRGSECPQESLARTGITADEEYGGDGQGNA
ncbi:MAG: hypothetical protein HYZ13_16875 [Acidobacteria bacterium]|nr:hypothetical protein [Acidobacteriota bacterium]